MPTPSADITGLLAAWREGDAAAGEHVLAAAYQELHRQAARAMRREQDGHTLQPTALVNEAVLRLFDQQRVDWQSRAHFYGLAAQLMRRILVDHARARHADKRGGAVRPIALDGVDAAQPEPATDLLVLHEALERLATFDALQARIVEMRYFGGLTIEETAAAVSRSPATVKREWAIARAWLRRELEREAS